LYFMARDRYAPTAFLRMGDRLAFTAGILVLAVPAAIVYAAFNGHTESLIPLFAVGVFVAFTLAQSGMVAHWWRHREPGWQRALAISLLGAALSGTVAIIAAVTKFVEGAWLVVVLIPLIVLACLRIHRAYTHAHRQLVPRAGEEPAAAPAHLPCLPPARNGHRAASEEQEDPGEVRHLVVVPVAVLDLSALRALAYAASLQLPILAVHMSPSERGGEALQPVLGRVGRPPATRGRRLALPRHCRPAGQLHRSPTPPAT
jgi:hypothetical protein